MWQTLVEEVVFVKSVVMLSCFELKGMNERFISREEATIRICVHLIARRGIKKNKRGNCNLYEWKFASHVPRPSGTRKLSERYVAGIKGRGSDNCHTVEAQTSLIRSFKSSQWITTLKPLESSLGTAIIKSWTGITSDSSVSKRSNFGPPLGRNKTARTKLISAYARLSEAGPFYFQQKDIFIGMGPGMKNVIEHEKRGILAYFIPRQLRDPFAKGTRFLFMRGSTFPSQRSGINLYDFSYTRGSVCMKYADMLTGTYMHNPGFRFV